MHIHTHTSDTHTHTFSHVHMHIHIPLFIRIHMHIHIGIHMHAIAHASADMPNRTRTHTNININILMHIHIHIHIRVQIQIHIHMHVYKSINIHVVHSVYMCIYVHVQAAAAVMLLCYSSSGLLDLYSFTSHQHIARRLADSTPNVPKTQCLDFASCTPRSNAESPRLQNRELFRELQHPNVGTSSLQVPSSRFCQRHRARIRVHVVLDCGARSTRTGAANSMEPFRDHLPAVHKRCGSHGKSSSSSSTS